jgi:hypothetical protein
LEIFTTKTKAKADRKALVTLRFAGDDLDPKEVSAILPIEPTRAHKKGEEFFAGTLRDRTGMWFLATDKLVDSDDLADHLRFVQEFLYPAPSDKGRITEPPQTIGALARRRPRHLLLARRSQRTRTANPDSIYVSDKALVRRHRNRLRRG